MSLAELIQKAVDVVGTQKALADMIGETSSHISAFKKGTRPCSLKKRAQIAEIAGVDITRALLEGAMEGLSDDIAREATAKKGILAILNAFPQT